MHFTKPDDSKTPTRDELLKTTGGQLYLESWLANRLVVGLLGVIMPVVLIIGEAAFFGVTTFPRSSLSAYFFSGLGGVFVGTLCSTGVFLITYMALHWNKDNVISTAAGIFAIGVALFPTWPDVGEAPTPLQVKLGETATQVIHSGSAILFIAMLAVMSYRFADREDKRGNKKLRIAHIACAIAMVASAGLAVIGRMMGIQQIGGWSGLLLVELACTYAFGISWLLKGAEISDRLIALGLCGNRLLLRRPGNEPSLSTPPTRAEGLGGPDHGTIPAPTPERPSIMRSSPADRSP